MTAITSHLCYQRRHWNVGYNRELRNYFYCVISIPSSTLHRCIHEWVSDIPAPKPLSSKLALEQLEMLRAHGAIQNTDPIDKRLTILIALFDCIEQPTADGFRRQLKIVQEYKKGPLE